MRSRLSPYVIAISLLLGLALSTPAAAFLCTKAHPTRCEAQDGVASAEAIQLGGSS
jgi:hypothetical protein